MTNDVIRTLKDTFEDRHSFTKNELEDALRSFYTKTYKNPTYRWRIHDLKERGIIENISRGVYAFPGQHREFIPEITSDIITLHQKVFDKLPYTSFSFTDSRWYNEFMVHQVFKTYIILEVEKEAKESVYHFVDDDEHMIYLSPTRDVYERYIKNNDKHRPLIINNIVSEAPLIEVSGVKTASLEKLLVDCVADEIKFAAQWEEKENIFKAAFEKYSVSLPKLKRYAKRRNRTKQIEELLNKATR
jgi:predicted transcriptional regulator of viral defense system